jgi:hypothetical protein
MLPVFGQFLDGKPLYSFEVPEIERDNGKAKGNGGGRDYEIMGAYR